MTQSVSLWEGSAGFSFSRELSFHSCPSANAEAECLGGGGERHGGSELGGTGTRGEWAAILFHRVHVRALSHPEPRPQRDGVGVGNGSE